MEKQQRIVEMAKDICRVQHNCDNVCKPISACDALRYAERAVEAGYVKVVRCKECQHWGGVTYGFTCRKFSGIETKICMGADNYCSYGEPKMKGGAE